jgi:hypothetical protein
MPLLNRINKLNQQKMKEKKWKLLFLILVFPWGGTFCQDYIPLIDTTIYWDIAEHSMGHICNYSYRLPTRYFFKGDTVINGMNYKKVYAYDFMTEDPGSPGCPPFVIDTTYYLTDIFMRENLDEQKVYRYFPNTHSEELLYDFSVSIGDTLFGYAVVDTIYSVTTNDGLSRKCISFNKRCRNCGDRFIEGIGGPQGPFELPFEFFEEGYFILCIKDESSVIEDISGCYDFITSINEKNLNYNLKIYPNPVSDLLHIDFKNISGNKLVKILNVFGQKIDSYSTNEKNIEIDFSKVKTGVFFVNIVTDVSENMNYKLIKK